MTRQKYKRISFQILALILLCSVFISSIFIPAQAQTPDSTTIYMTGGRQTAQDLLNNFYWGDYGKNSEIQYGIFYDSTGEQGDLVEITLPENEKNQALKCADELYSCIVNNETPQISIPYGSFTKNNTFAEVTNIIGELAMQKLWDNHPESRYVYSSSNSPYFIDIDSVKGQDHCTVTYCIPNFLSDSEIQYCDSEIKKIYSKLDLKGKSNLQKLQTIHNYVHKNISYDHDLNNNSSTKEEVRKNRNAYGALKRKKGTCAGYSEIIFKLAHLAKIPNVRLRSGYGYKALYEKHAWCTYTEKGKTYIIDGTANNCPKKDPENYYTTFSDDKSDFIFYENTFAELSQQLYQKCTQLTDKN